MSIRVTLHKDGYLLELDRQPIAYFTTLVEAVKYGFRFGQFLLA